MSDDIRDDVIDLKTNRPGPAGDTEALLAYWTGLRQGGSVPKRAEIDPRRIEGLLSQTFILERIAPGLARFRVAGTHLAELMGMDVRGMPVSSFISPEGREDFGLTLARLFEEPATVQLDLVSRARLGRPALTGRMLLLPLRSDLGDVSRAMGCLVTDGDAGRAPRRFDVTRLRVAPVNGGPVEVQRPVVAPPPVPEQRGRPHLRLVTSD